MESLNKVKEQNQQRLKFVDRYFASVANSNQNLLAPLDFINWCIYQLLKSNNCNNNCIVCFCAERNTPISIKK